MPVSTSGNVLDNDDFGEDGRGDPPILDIDYIGGAVDVANVTKSGPDLDDPNGTVTFVFDGPEGSWELVIFTKGPNAGDYSFTQLEAFNHGGAEFADFQFEYTMQDLTGETASAVLTTRIIDDDPVVEVGPVTVVIDESEDPQPDTDDIPDGDAQEIEALFTALGVGLDDVIAVAKSNDIDVDIDPGVDGIKPPSLSNASGEPFMGEQAGTKTTDGETIYLWSDQSDPNLIVAGTDPDNIPFGDEVVAILYLETDPEGLPENFWVVLFQSIGHDDPNDADEADNPQAVDTVIFVTVEDNDGSKFTSQNTINIFLRDDGPTIDLKPEEWAGLRAAAVPADRTVDEADLETTDPSQVFGFAVDSALPVDSLR